MQKTEGCVLCLGFFDGLHLGHQALLKAGRRAADGLGLPLCAHTFDRSPFKQALTTLEERTVLLKAFGADQVHVTVFDETVRCMTGEDFFHSVMVGELHAAYIICGADHRFGHQGKWDAAALKEMCRAAGIGFETLDAVCMEGEKVSSSAIRRALQTRNEAKAERLLGRKVPARWKQVMET